MADLIVLVPSRGRPDAARELQQAIRDTSTGDTDVAFVVDSDDPTKDQYTGVDRLIIQPGGSMVAALNRAARLVVGSPDPPFAVAFLGDDHRPRTVGWDSTCIDALRELGTGLVYGNDLFQRSRLPTQVVMTSDIVRTLGFMAPECFKHLFVDNYWLELGSRAHCIRYLPDVVIEHLHPVAGKAEWDPGYRRVNSTQVQRSDRSTWFRYRQEQLPQEVDLIRELRGWTGA